MENKWELTTLGDFTYINPLETLKKGSVVKKVSMDALSPFTRLPSNFQLEPYNGGAKFKNGDTIVARITPCLENGKTALVTILDDKEVGFGSTEYIVLREKKSISISKYIYYLAISPDFRHIAIQSMTGSSGRQRVQTDVLARHPFLSPPLPTQEAIAHILGTLDDKIELLRHMNDTLEAMARALFKSWFIDFDPVHKKAEGLPTGLPPEIDALFPDSFEASELGEIPKGWCVKTLGEVVEIAGGSTPSTKEPSFWDGTYKFATPKDLSLLNSPIVTNTERSITEQGVMQISSAQLPRGTLLLSSRAPIGYLAVTDIPVSINQGFIAVREESLLPPLYMYFWCKENMETIIGNANGTTFLEISKSSFRTIKIVLPQKAIVDQYCKEASVMFSMIAKNIHENKTLIEIRDSLLPKLISGDLEVKDIEKILEPAT